MKTRVIHVNVDGLGQIRYADPQPFRFLDLVFLLCLLLIFWHLIGN